MRGSAREVKSGDVLHLTRAASVQFLRPIFVRVIRLPDWVTYDGWLWIEGRPDPAVLHTRFLGWLSLARRSRRADPD
ncbi:hypothetical protein ACLQ29_13380 [Micromonospora sp. DT228]|uniref:hypothetical protein n=1 Tax=Micromonospora sp. DT228 TaxID=3393443 RepID=UPI003CF5D1F3